MALKRKVSVADGTFVKFQKIGDSVAGVYLGATYQENGNYGPQDNHRFQAVNGEIKIVSARRRINPKNGVLTKATLTQDLEGDEGKFLVVTYSSTRIDTKNPQNHPKKIYSIDVEQDFQQLSPEDLANTGASSYDDEVDEEVVEYEEEPVAPIRTPVAATATAISADERKAKIAAAMNRRAK